MRTEDDLEGTLYAKADLTVDTDALLAGVKRATGRRRRRRVVGAGVGAAGAVTIAALAVPALLWTSPGTIGPDLGSPAVGLTPSRAPFTGDCTVDALADPADVPPGLPMMVTDMDPSGRYIVGSYGPPVDPDDNGWSNQDNRLGRMLPVRWDNGVPHVLAVAGDDVYANAVNGSGTVVGTMRPTVNGRKVFAAWVDRESTGAGWSLLPTPAGHESLWAGAINEHGEIVGAIGNAGGGDEIPVVWSPKADGTYSLRQLPTPSPGSAYPVGITGGGSVVGNLRSAGPYVWDPDGTGRALPLPDDKPVGGVAQVRGDWAVGYAAERGEGGSYVRIVGVRWNLSTGEMSIVDVSTERISGWVVNAAGDVVSPGASGAVLVRGGRSYDLPRLPGLPQHGLDAEPAAISDDATVIVGTQPSGGETINRGVLWRC